MRNYLVEINKELMFFVKVWGIFVSMQGRKKEGRKEDRRGASERNRGPSTTGGLGTKTERGRNKHIEPVRNRSTYVG